MALYDYNLYSFYNGNAEDTLGEIAAKIATQNFDFRYVTFLFFNSTLWCSIEVFLRLYNYNIIVNKGAFNPGLGNTTRQFVLFGLHVTEIAQALDVIKEHEMDNTGKFIIICQSRKQKECDEAETMILFWEHNIVNVVFIKTGNAIATVYTYYPISNGKCGNLVPVKFNTSICSNDGTSSCRDMYGCKLKKLHYCPLIVSTFIQTPYMAINEGKPTGADGDLLRIIADGLNTKFILMTPHRGDGWGWRQDNGTWMGSLADIHEDLANMSMTSAAITQTRYSDFQLSHSYYTVNVGWVTHPAKLQPVALKLLYPFHTSTEIALVASYTLVILCAFLVRTNMWLSICRKIHVVQSTRSMIFYSWMICMGQPLTKFPTKTAFLQVIMLWICYCFLVRTAYQVYLISSLKGAFYQDQFDTIEDAIAAQYPIGGGAALKDYYIDNPIVYDNWINVDAPDIFPTVMNISKGMKFVLAMNLDTAKVFLKQYKIHLHILSQKIIISPTAIFFKKYSPLVETVNTVLDRLIASGFPEKFHQNYTSVPVDLHLQSDKKETINMQHYTGCYILLITGWIMSILFFCLEVHYGKL